MAPLVSIILINWNTPKVTAECLATLRNVTYRPLEVIVVDNGSTDDSMQVLPRQFPEFRFVPAGKNLGFTGGNNLGMAVARGDCFLLLNNDTEVPPNFLKPLVDRLLFRDSVGVVSPKIRYHHTPDVIQYAGSTPIHPVTGRGGFIGSGERDAGQHDEARQTYIAHGAAMLVKRSVAEKVGVLFDPMFIYYEELDWSERIRKAGYEIWYEPKSLVMHKESITVGKASPRKVHMQTRNRIVFIRRNSPSWAVAIFYMYYILVAMPLRLLRYLLAGQKEFAEAFFRGSKEGLTFQGIDSQTRLEFISISSNIADTKGI